MFIPRCCRQHDVHDVLLVDAAGDLMMGRDGVSRCMHGRVHELLKLKGRAGGRIYVCIYMYCYRAQ